ncbi:MAG TPA: iron ABC transporter substrate-binding protein [Desulfobacteraceae bacterium]|nr:iron ABC transporter substrate-binding protein [Desulfobacteraceae bacterium]
MQYVHFKRYAKSVAIRLLFTALFFIPKAYCEPFHVTDSAGRRVLLENAPERIACLYAFTGHVVTMLGRGGDMVAIVNGLKKDVLLNRIQPEIRNTPVPARGGVIHIEALLKTRPDIVFLKPDTATIASEIKKLEQFNLPYFIAGYRSMAQQMTIIEQIGKAVGKTNKAKAYTQYYRNVISRVKQVTDHIGQKERIRIYHSSNEPTRTDAPGTLEADWTKAAGVINVSVESRLQARGGKYFADIEQIILWNPDVIIVNEDGVDHEILTDQKWAPIKAVNQKKVFPIPVGISRWGHPGGLETPLAILWTAQKVYPQRFEHIDLKAEIRNFYHRFFNLDLTDDMIDKILANQNMRRDP